MIHLFTDFGPQDWYVGQMRAVLAHAAPAVPVIDLMHGLTPFDVQSAAYLLGALAGQFPDGAIVLGVVDPGVGGSRRPILVEADGRRYVGPDNGLFSLVWRRAKIRRAFAIDWRPAGMSSSFHGRDLFAPVAAMLAGGKVPATTEITDPVAPSGWPDDLWRVIHIDRYGNAVSGVGGTAVNDRAVLEMCGQTVPYARTFSAGPPGRLLWHRNSLNLVEVSLPGESAAGRYGFVVGEAIIKVK